MKELYRTKFNPILTNDNLMWRTWISLYNLGYINFQFRILRRLFLFVVIHFYAKNLAKTWKMLKYNFLILVICIDRYHHHHWQNSPFWSVAFFRRFCRNDPVSTSLDFEKVIFFTWPSAFRPKTNLETRFLYLRPPVTGWPSYTPRHRVPFFSPSTAPRGTVEALWPVSAQWVVCIITCNI
jgi:hypothetical protein